MSSPEDVGSGSFNGDPVDANHEHLTARFTEVTLGVKRAREEYEPPRPQRDAEPAEPSAATWSVTDSIASLMAADGSEDDGELIVLPDDLVSSPDVSNNEISAAASSIGYPAFPQTPAPPVSRATKMAVPPRSGPAEPPHRVPTPSTPAPVTPSSARVPGNVPCKTPVSTPVTSLIATPASLGSLATSINTQTSATSFPVDPKRHARMERWANVLAPAMMLERESDEQPRIKELCMRISSAIPGDKQEAQDAFLMLLVNLKDPKNQKLRGRIVDGVLPVEVLVTLGEHDLVNPERREQLDAEFEVRAKNTNMLELRKAVMTSSSLFPCPRCKAKDCTWYQRQTRSGDEPMTVFCTCNRCNCVWKRS